jgi:Fe-S cluster assembly iron-binding protein IscA
MNIAITDEAAARLRELLEEEGGDAVVRIRETKIGDG